LRQETEMFRRKILIALGIAGLATSAAAVATIDFGKIRDQQLASQAEQLFGIALALQASSTESITGIDAEANPSALVTLSQHLTAHVLSAKSNLGANIDMMALWPNDENPTPLIACNETDN